MRTEGVAETYARDPKFWDGGLSVIARLIEELERLE